MTPVLAAIGHGSTALWYLTRATGLVAMVLLSASVVLGIVCSIGWVSERWPRFVSQAVHRNVSLVALALIVIHVVTTVADGYVPISLFDAVIPFRTPYRPLWVGLGACAFDVLLAIAVTTALRRRIGVRTWRLVHWLAYACWPIALFHGLGAGSDTRLPGAQFIYLVCVVAVIAALGWRLVASSSMTSTLRVGAAVGATFVLFAAVLFALLGPLRPGWSRRAGTSSALLSQLSAVTAATSTRGSSGTVPTATGGVPPAPFTSSLSGSYTTAGPDSTGREQLVFTLRLSDGVPLRLTLDGQADDGGVRMTSSAVSLGTLNGSVTALQGQSVDATVTGAGATDDLSIELVIDRFSHSVSGSISGVRGSNG